MTKLLFHINGLLRRNPTKSTKLMRIEASSKTGKPCRAVKRVIEDWLAAGEEEELRRYIHGGGEWDPLLDVVELVQESIEKSESMVSC